MRDTTKIKAVAGEALADIAAPSVTISPASAKESLISNLKEIVNLATRMDARTGTSDPSTKK